MKAVFYVSNATGRENQETDFLVPVAVEKDLNSMREKSFSQNMQKFLLKRAAAEQKFEARRQAFFLEKQQITADIKEAGDIWKKTLAMLPYKEFN